MCACMCMCVCVCVSHEMSDKSQCHQIINLLPSLYVIRYDRGGVDLILVSRVCISSTLYVLNFK